MKLTKFDNARAFLEKNAAFLEREEAANNLLLGLAISNQANAEDQSLYLNISDGEEIVFAASRMPGRNLIAFGDETRYDKWASVFTSFISEEQPTLPGVIGPKRIAELLADSLAALRECTTETKFQQMVFELTEVKLNPDIEGKLEKGRIDQLDQIAPWMQAFYREAMHADWRSPNCLLRKSPHAKRYYPQLCIYPARKSSSGTGDQNSCRSQFENAGGRLSVLLAFY